jgi:hypothetical protein
MWHYKALPRELCMLWSFFGYDCKATYNRKGLAQFDGPIGVRVGKVDRYNNFYNHTLFWEKFRGWENYLLVIATAKPKYYENGKGYYGIGVLT